MGFLGNNDGFNSHFMPGSKLGDFSDPFLLPSNEYFPTRLDNMWDFCAHLWYLNPTYRQASMRVCSHFITDIKFEGKSGDRREQNNFYDLLRDSVQVKLGMLHMGMEWCSYGNGFSWMYFPFNRFLVDDRDKDRPKEWALDVAMKLGDVKYHWNTMEYEVWDPKLITKPKKDWKKVRLKFRDRRTLELEKIRTLMLDPRYITLRYSRWSGHTDVIWRFDPEFLSDVHNNMLHQINHTPIGMLRAIANDQDFLFHPDEVFHLKAPVISGISNFGWGMPEVLANYRELHQVQVYRKIDEAVGLDYMLPFRLFSPNVSSSQAGESTYHTLLGEWEHNVKSLIKDRRSDPFAMHAMPFPVTYQEFGAEGKQLAPKELMAQQNDSMLNGMGYPAELFHGTLQVNQIPTTLRLFENAFQHLFRGFHNYLKWTARRIQEHAQMETMEVSLQPPSLADDLEKRPIYLQLAAGGEFPRSMAYKDLGIDDPVEAGRERFEEDIELEKVRNETTERYQREQAMGSLSDQVLSQQEGAAGGVPGDGGGGALTPLDIMQQAEQEAQAIVGMDQGQAQQRYDQLRQSDPNLYAMVKQKAEDIRNMAESQGRASLKGGG